MNHKQHNVPKTEMELCDSALDAVYGGTSERYYLVTCRRCGKKFATATLSAKHCETCRQEMEDQ